MRLASLVILAGLVLSARLEAADGESKKWLPGRWAPSAAEKKPDSEPKASLRRKAKTKLRSKRLAAKKTAEELPKLVLEFTKDGKVRLDGDPSALGDTFRFIKPLAAFPMKFAPENKYLKIDYHFIGDDSVEVSADHSWLMEKLSAGGGPIAPEKAKELLREYRPRERLAVTATSKELTLSNEQGKTVTFRRYSGEALDVAESKRRAQEVRRGLAPFQDILKQQGINIGAPATGKSAPK
jgi:hypothetical protein